MFVIIGITEYKCFRIYIYILYLLIYKILKLKIFSRVQSCTLFIKHNIETQLLCNCKNVMSVFFYFREIEIIDVNIDFLYSLCNVIIKLMVAFVLTYILIQRN